MSHFEEVLKVVGLMKNFAMKCDPHVTQQTGDVTSSVTTLCQPHPPLQVTLHHCQRLKSLGQCYTPLAPN